MKDLIEDITDTAWLASKIKSSTTYAQNIYAALCNNTYETTDKNTTDYLISWRRAARMVAEIREEGDYIDWYCSGMGTIEGYVPEGTITEKVKADLLKIGWLTVKEEGVI